MSQKLPVLSKVLLAFFLMLILANFFVFGLSSFSAIIGSCFLTSLAVAKTKGTGAKFVVGMGSFMAALLCLVFLIPPIMSLTPAGQASLAEEAKQKEERSAARKEKEEELRKQEEAAQKENEKKLVEEQTKDEEPSKQTNDEDVLGYLLELTDKDKSWTYDILDEAYFFCKNKDTANEFCIGYFVKNASWSAMKSETDPTYQDYPWYNITKEQVFELAK